MASVFLLLSLVEGVGNQAEEARLQIEAIKTGLTVGAGTGGALALLLTARKRWLNERERLLQIRTSQVGTCTHLMPSSEERTRRAIDELFGGEEEA
ncbi:hypothetical protein Q2K19_19260 [Micromonospora soli]|uniref:hypothetical protein n=1 Tax=Micromonospora sp. NBRC 110009 TaxID=3061627 RepID=UPI002673947C|nr:hypothetical protein [Micromonospora sp. NBRC 110009]WKT96356.1 hypothetical protein Q2K19_19260 [Micromonospora sp. NBRC 110009]